MSDSDSHSSWLWAATGVVVTILAFVFWGFLFVLALVLYAIGVYKAPWFGARPSQALTLKVPIVVAIGGGLFLFWWHVPQPDFGKAIKEALTNGVEKQQAGIQLPASPDAGVGAPVMASPTPSPIASPSPSPSPSSTPSPSPSPTPTPSPVPTPPKRPKQTMYEAYQSRTPAFESTDVPYPFPITGERNLVRAIARIVEEQTMHPSYHTQWLVNLVVYIPPLQDRADGFNANQACGGVIRNQSDIYAHVISTLRKEMKNRMPVEVVPTGNLIIYTDAKLTAGSAHQLMQNSKVTIVYDKRAL